MVNPNNKPNSEMSARDKELEALLGKEEFKAFTEFQAALERKAKIRKAKELAVAAVGEGGKYGVAYKKLEDQLNAIWDKAMVEARQTAGVVEPEES